MRHREVLLAPLLMVFDYYLTLLGAYLAEHSYRQHFKTAHYELNPFWQNAMARRQWINFRHLAGVVLAGGSLVVLTNVLEPDDVFLNPLLGFVLTCYAVVLGRHLSNVLTFVHLARRPDDVTGEIHLSRDFVAVHLPAFGGGDSHRLHRYVFAERLRLWRSCCGRSIGSSTHSGWRGRARRAPNE